MAIHRRSQIIYSITPIRQKAPKDHIIAGYLTSKTESYEPDLTRIVQKHPESKAFRNMN